MLMILYGGAGIMLACVSLLPPLYTVLALLFIGMMCLGAGNGSVFQLVPLRFGSEIGIVTGIVGAAGGIGGYLLPQILGNLYQKTGAYTAGFLVLSGIAIFCILMLALAQSDWKKNWIGTGGRAVKSAELEISR